MSESDREVIGIRGLDSNLYQQMLAKAKELGKNVSELMNDALKLYLNQVLAASTIGEGSVNLELSKTDLEKLGKVIIRGVVHVKFSEDVDDKTIEEHVVALENCVNVTVPKQAYLNAVTRAKNCINIKPYSEKPLPTFEKETQISEATRIGDIENLELSKEDFETLGKKVVLENIKHLKLSPDVDEETVNNYIEIIQDVEQLEVPKRVYVLILTKQRNCETVTKY